MIVKLKNVPGNSIIGEVKGIRTGFYDIYETIKRFDKSDDHCSALRDCYGKEYEKKVQDSNMIFSIVAFEFASGEVQNGECHNFLRLEEEDDYRQYAVAIKVIAKHSEDTYITNQSIYLMNDNGETIERIN